jgi:hypothetical protein
VAHHPLFRDFRLEDRVAAAIDEAYLRWQAAERAWLAIEFVLNNDPGVGTPLIETGRIRSFFFHGAKSIDMPDVTVIYEATENLVVVHDATFEDAKAPFAGRA